MGFSRTSVFYAVAAATAVLDQVTKLAARKMLTPGKQLTVVPGFFDLELTYNTGVAFGILPDWTPLLIILGLCAVYAFVRLGSTTAPKNPRLTYAVAMLAGGAAGNLIDRLVSRKRAVTDFLSFHITISGKTYCWPSFNLADVGIVVGAVILIVTMYVSEKRRDIK
ncbi:MAG: signal peptidase II [Armatimonadota bacterium]|nr:signal peptidase II [Armatimonadota bacterium]